MSNNDQIESTEYREDEVRHAKSALARFELEEDPHRAALEDNPDKVHVSLTTWASIAVSIPPGDMLFSWRPGHADVLYVAFSSCLYHLAPRLASLSSVSPPSR